MAEIEAAASCLGGLHNLGSKEATGFPGFGVTKNLRYLFGMVTIVLGCLRLSRVHWGYRVLTHSHINKVCKNRAPHVH